MNVLIIGGGGREHAVAWKLAQSRKVDKLWCAPGNGGIASLCECLPIKATDIQGIVEWSKKNHPDMVVVTPDDPLALGMVDALEAEGIRAFGPSKAAARIEASKSFAKNLMRKYNIPTARCEIFDNEQDAADYIRHEGAPIVIKADGLALGKGVVVASTVDEALSALHSNMEGVFGDAGRRVVIEECLEGPEVSVLCFTDGKTIVPMTSSQDHKRAFDGDKGPNTGGMGAVSPVPIYTPEIAGRVMDEILLPAIRGMEAEGCVFRGVLYAGLMLTKDGPKVIEFNARFGDPETQAVLPLLKTDLFDIFSSCIDGTLEKLDIHWRDRSCACVVMASGGYPKKYKTGFPISGLGDVPDDAGVFYAGTKLQNGHMITSGGRVLAVAACGDDLPDALKKAYAGVDKISFEGASYRRDIGKKYR